MKEFKAQVCQYVRDLIADQRNAEELNTAAKSLYNGVCKKTFSVVGDRKYSYWRDDEFILIPDARREGKFSFSGDYITMSYADFMAYLDLSGRRKTFARVVLREFSLLDWHYDFSSFALKNEFWEFDWFVFGSMFDDLYEIIKSKARDARQFKQQFKTLHLLEGLDSTNWLGLLTVRHAVRFMQETAPELFIDLLVPDDVPLHWILILQDDVDRVSWLCEAYPALSRGKYKDFMTAQLIKRARWFVQWYTDEDSYFYAKVKEGGLGHVE